MSQPTWRLAGKRRLDLAFITILFFIACPNPLFAGTNSLIGDIQIFESENVIIQVSSTDIRRRLLNGQNVFFVKDQEETKKVINSDLIVEALRSGAKKLAIRNAVISGDLNWADAGTQYVPITRFPFDPTVMRGLRISGIEGYNIISIPIEIFESRFKGEIKIPAFSPFNQTRMAAFVGPVHIMDSVFEKPVDFKFVYFSYMNFIRNTFQENASFGRALFQGSAVFDDVVFQKEAHFWNAIFGFESNIASFRKVTFKGRTFFSDARFLIEADFSDSSFNEYVNFDRVSFNKSANFFGAAFSKDVDFYLTNYTTLLIKWSQVEGRLDSSLKELLVFTEKVNKELKEKQITITDYLAKDAPELPSALKKQMLSRTILVTWTDVYLRLIKNFENIGDDDSAMEAYYFYRSNRPTFKIVENNILVRSKWEKVKELGEHVLIGFTVGYGVKYWRPVRLGGIVILFFTLCFYFFDGTRFGSLESGESWYYRRHRWHRFFNCLYFSVMTFSTMGNSTLQPKGKLFKSLEMTEGLLGGIIIALFLVTLANVWMKY